ncbi:hypothetical protein BN971_03107 [Mycobacterium bohemicum DSM 44277]|uniref:Uncharacterized protein n=1 Tax=Mycobacterium bohemicum DSM 44277 TaxID=1236609 RepID=A0A0U0WAG5_MYCBE|nr:hypothetical protein BN971_03107 [Mycobacterium bohemicum DSM 44277]
MSVESIEQLVTRAADPTYSAREAAALLGRSFSWLDRRVRRDEFVLADGTVVQPPPHLKVAHGSSVLPMQEPVQNRLDEFLDDRVSRWRLGSEIRRTQGGHPGDHRHG